MNSRINQSLLAQVRELEINPEKYPNKGVLWYRCEDGHRSANQELEKWALESGIALDGVAIVSDWQTNLKVQHILNPDDFNFYRSTECDEYDQAYSELVEYCRS